jgi:type IV secretory pathway protease TraF
VKSVAHPPHLRVVIAATVVMAAVAAFVSSHYRIMWDGQAHSCFPYTMYWVEPGRTDPVRDALFAFHVHGLEPHFKDGTIFLKRMAAVPGDHVDEQDGVLRVNGVPQVELNPSTLAKLHATPADFIRHLVVPSGHYLFLASARDSYDGRYWGLVAAPQLVGRAFPLW